MTPDKTEDFVTTELAHGINFLYSTDEKHITNCEKSRQISVIVIIWKTVQMNFFMITDTIMLMTAEALGLMTNLKCILMT